MSNLMKIILFRHGQKQHTDLALTSNKNGVNLTDLGIIQITKLGQALAKNFPELVSLSTIYSSPYTRALQSAEIIKLILNIKNVVVIDELSEFNAFNNYQNPKSIRDHLQEMAMQNPNWISPETHNSLKHVISSFENKLKEICLNSSEKCILISSHGGIICNFVYSLEPKFRPSDELILESKIHEGGYTVFNFDGQNFSVDQFDVCDHLKN